MLFTKLREEKVLYFGLIAAIFTAVLLLGACGESTEERVAEVGGVTARQIIDNPAAYVGKTVTVSGEIEEIYNPRAFVIDSGYSVGELPVFGREPFPLVPDKENRAYVVSDVATVTGVVQMLVTADVQREIGWDLTPDIIAKFNAKPVLIAQNVSFRPGAGKTANPSGNTGASDLTNPNANDSNSTKANTGGETTGANNPTGANSNASPEVDILAIVAAPQQVQLVGKRVQLTKVKVLDVVGDRTFYVGSNENQRVLVVLDETKTPNTATEGRYDIKKGQVISFSGEVRRMPSVDEAKRQFGNLMSDSALKNLSDQKIYVHTDKINILEGAE